MVSSSCTISVADLSPQTIVRDGIFATLESVHTIMNDPATLVARLHVDGERWVRIHEARELLAQQRPGVSKATHHWRLSLNRDGARMVRPVMLGGKRCAATPVSRRATTLASVRRPAMMREGQVSRAA